MKLKRHRNTTLLVVLAFVALAVYAVLRLMPGSDMLEYFKAEASQINGMTDRLKSEYGRLYKEREPYIEEPSRIKTEVFLNLNQEEQDGLFGLGQFSQMLNKFSLVCDSRINPAESKVLSDLSLNLEGVPVVAGRYIKEGEELYISVPTLLMEKYLKADIGNMEQLLENMGVSGIPEEARPLMSFALPKDRLEPSEFEGRLNRLLKKLGTVITEYMDEDDVVLGDVDDVEEALWGDDAKKVIVKLGPDKAGDMISSAVSAVKEEGGFDLMASFIGLAGGETGWYLSTVSDSVVPEVDKVVNRLEFTNGISMEVMIDSKGEIVSREIDFKCRVTGIEGLFRVEIGVLPGNEYHTAVYEVHDNGESVMVNFDVSRENRQDHNETYTGTEIEATFNTGSGGMHLRADFDKSEKPADEGNGVTQVTEFEISVSGLEALDDRMATDGKNIVSGQVEKTKKVDEKNRINYIDYRINTNVRIAAEGVEGKGGVILGITREDMMGVGDFDLPDLTDVKIIDLNNASGDELEQVKMDLMMSIGLIMLGSGMFTF